ncbi:MAG: hypothetical protein COV44_09075 [Deltaproteobacteria bacterium CG11_big_fil_rev_8_21_14_0_20_45_16]|nr:MAG: hypothetical protein COV44_09075 [Deltaproteobacteria bacterium CG11_big_fil_rev_8_21_14_0_20_45_16]
MNQLTRSALRGLLLAAQSLGAISLRGKSWEELTPKTRLKLYVICFLINKELLLLTPDSIIQILNQHIYENPEGFKDSVLSALETNRYNEATIINIGRLAHKSYLAKQQKMAPSLPDAIPA